jgi:hypothetical protein
MPDKALHIGPVPERKSIAIYLRDGVRPMPVAYFKTPEDARAVLAFLDTLIPTREVSDGDNE